MLCSEFSEVVIKRLCSIIMKVKLKYKELEDQKKEKHVEIQDRLNQIFRLIILDRHCKQIVYEQIHGRTEEFLRLFFGQR